MAMLDSSVIKNKSKDVASGLFRYMIFAAISYVLLYPFLYVLINSVKSFSDSYDITVTWVPKTLYFGNIAAAFKVFDLSNTVVRTVIYEIISALIQFCSAAVAAYGLARFKVPFKKLFTVILILNILVPSMMIIIPTYVNFSRVDFLGVLGLLFKITGKDLRPNILGSPLVFYLPSLCSVGLKGGLFIYIYMQFFKGLPKELEEAAWIDGAGSWRTFLQIVVPSTGAASVIVLLFSVVWHWNDYYLAQMYMDKPTFAVAINSYSGNITSSVLGLDIATVRMMDVQILLAGCLLFIIPMLVFYLLIQKKFIASIASSGIVG